MKREGLAAWLVRPVAAGKLRTLDGAILGLLVLQAVAGALLLAFYVPSTKDAWSSLVFLEAATPGGRVLRGMHHFFSHAIVLGSLVSLVAGALGSVYAPPRQTVWLLRLGRLGTLLGLAVTGHGLPWDQAAYWARRVELTITGMVPVVGPRLAALVAGGPELGQLGLLRLYALHVAWLPFVLAVLVLLERRAEERAAEVEGDARVPWFPGPAAREAVAVLLVSLAVLLFALRGAPLEAPADPTSTYPARPEWFLLPLYRVRSFFHGPVAEVLGTGAGLLVFAAHFALQPFLDRRARRPMVRAVTVVLVASAIGLAGATVLADRKDATTLAARAAGRARAERARALATAGVPPAGALAMMRADPELRGEDLFVEKCASCHVLGPLGDRKEAKAPKLDGWSTAPWIRRLLHEPDHEDLFGRSAFAGMMPSMDVAPKDPKADAPPFHAMSGEDMDAVAAFLAAQGDDLDGGVADAGASRGETIVREQCTGCHLWRGEGDDLALEHAPELAGYGSLAWARAQVHDPASAATYREKAHAEDLESTMPAFAEEMSPADVDLVARWTRARARGLPFR